MRGWSFFKPGARGEYFLSVMKIYSTKIKGYEKFTPKFKGYENFTLKNKGYEKNSHFPLPKMPFLFSAAYKMKFSWGMKLIGEKNKGYEKIRGKNKGYEILADNFKGSEFFGDFSEKYSPRAPGRKNDQPLRGFVFHLI